MAHIVYYRTQPVKGVFSLFQQRKEQQEINIGNGIESTVMSVMSVITVIMVIPDPLHGNHRRHRVHDMVFAAKLHERLPFDREGCVVTIGAMGCQKKIVRKIFVEKKYHYVVAPKDDQKTFHEEMRMPFEKELAANSGLFKKSKTVVGKHHGRIEKRTYCQTDYIGWFQDKDEWVGLRSVIMIVSERTTRNRETGKWETSTEKRLYITSLPVDPDRALMVVRAHWGIENRLHWTLDVTFGEDYCTARTLHVAENRATLTRIAVNLLNRCARKHKCGTKKARMMANQSPEALEEMLAA